MMRSQNSKPPLPPPYSSVLRENRTEYSQWSHTDNVLATSYSQQIAQISYTWHTVGMMLSCAMATHEGAQKKIHDQHFPPPPAPTKTCSTEFFVGFFFFGKAHFSWKLFGALCVSFFLTQLTPRGHALSTDYGD